MQLKRITVICIILSMFMLIAAPLAYADSSYEFNASEYSSYSGYMNVDANGKPVPSNGMGNNASLTYNNVFVEQTGTYKLSVEIVGAYGKNSCMIVFYDEIEVLRKALPLTDRYLYVELGEIPLVAGNNRLTFKVTDTESVYFTRFILERTGDTTTYIRNGDSADRQSTEGITDEKPSEGMNKSRFAEYEIEIACDGYYSLFTDCAVLEDNSSEVSLTVDESYSERVCIFGKGWYTPLKNRYSAVFLSAGKHTFRIQVETGAIRLFGLELKGIGESEARDFVSEINGSDLKSIGSVFEKHDNALINSYKLMLNKLSYKDFCYMKILGIKADNFSEFDKLAASYIAEETENPLVYFIHNGEKTAALMPGMSDVVFSEKLDENFLATVCLYNKDKNALESIRCVTIEKGQETVLEDFYFGGDEDFRVFFWQNGQILSPAMLPVNDNCIYVSQNGNDSASGTLLSPLKTIEEAALRADSLSDYGDVTVYFLPGEYFISDTIVLENCGKYSVTFKSSDKNNPAVITGGVKVGGWMLSSDGIYVADTTGIDDVRQLYVNGLPAVRARSKGVYYSYAYWDDEATEYEEDGFMVESSSFPVLATPEDAEICYNILWTIQRLPVKDVVEEDGVFTVKMDQPYYSEGVTMLCDGGVQPTVGNQFFVENDLTLLDEPGEFYFDKNSKKIYYIPYDNEDLSSAECVAAVTEKFISAKGDSPENRIKNISFKNLKFRYGAYTSANTTGTVSFQAECLSSSALYTSPSDSATGNRMDGQFVFENAENISFADCEISCMGSSGIVFGDGVINSEIEDCFFRDVGASAISVGNYNYTSETSPDVTAKNILVKNNVIVRPGIDFMFCPAISVYYANSVSIMHNTICDTPYSGISVGWGWGSPVSETVKCQDHLIIGNRIENISNAVRDGGHIYLLGGLSGTVVSENFISGSDDYGGIYFDSGSKGVIVTKNVAQKCKNWLFGGDSSTDVNVFENYTDGSGIAFSENADRNVQMTEPVVYENSEWKDNALKIYENSGATLKREYENELVPEWRENSVFNVPRYELLLENEILVEAEDYTGFFTYSNKEKPSVYLQGYRQAIGDLRQFDVFDYEVEAEEGDYIFEYRYTTGPYNPDFTGRIGISIFVNDNVAINKAMLPMTNTEWATHLPYRIGTIHLEEGKNKISIKNMYSGFSYDSFKLIKQ